MAWERMVNQIGERRRRRRRRNGTCSILNVDFNLGGGLLRLGAAGALLAAAFAAHRFLIRKRKSGSMPEPLDRVDLKGIQENSGKPLGPHAAVDGENEGERGVQICASECPTIIMAVEQTRLEDNVSYDHNDAIAHEIHRKHEKTEENPPKESREGMEGNRRETKEYSSAESRERIVFSMEQDNRDCLSNVSEAGKCLELERNGRADKLSVKTVVLEIRREPQIETAELFFDGAADNGAKRAEEATKHEAGTGLIQAKNVSGERRLQRAAAGHGLLAMTLAIVFAVLASFLWQKGFDAASHHRLGRLYCRLCQLFNPSYNNPAEEI